MGNEYLRKVVTIVAFASVALLGSTQAAAMCFRTDDLQRPWSNGQYVYQFDDSANNSVLRCGLSQNLTPAELAEYINPDTGNYYTIRELFLEGVDDWLNNASFPVGLAPLEYTGLEPERVVVTSFCDQSNHHKVESVPGYGVVRHLNLRPTVHTKTRFDRTVRHETGHSFGMAHMQQRWDRAQYVTTHPQNIDDDELPDFDTVFTVAQCNDVNLMLPYDFSSIMHYLPGEGPNCSTVENSGCQISPGSPHVGDPDYNPDYAADFTKMANALEISVLDYRALQYYYPIQPPDRVGVFNPEARLWSFVHMNQGILASGNTSSQLSTRDPSAPGSYRAIYGDGIQSARPLVGPWDNGPWDRLGEVYHGGDLEPFWFRGDENANGNHSDDPQGFLFVSASAKFVTVDTAQGMALVAYVPGADLALRDLDHDGQPDNGGTTPSGLFYPSLDDEPFSGDFTGDGMRTLAVREANTGVIYIDLDGDLEFDVWTQPWLPGSQDIRPLAGDWNGDGRDDIGVYDPVARIFYLDRDGTSDLNLDADSSSDLVFEFESGTPQTGDPYLWPVAGQFDQTTLRTDIRNTWPWSLPSCELMSDGIVHCMEAWGWCVDIEEASNACYQGVACGEYIGVNFPDYDWPAGCIWSDFGGFFHLHCDLNPDCTPA